MKSKKKILDDREVKDVILNSILTTTINKMENNAYCREILKNSGYYAQERPDNYDAEHFYLEKIYIGYSDKRVCPEAHCTKESFYFLNRRQELENSHDGTATRDAVYISDRMAKKIAINALKDITKNDKKITEFIENLEQKYSSDNNQIDYNQVYDEIKPSLEKILNNENNTKFKDKFLDIASTEMICYTAHECSHANQMQQGLDNGAMYTKSLHNKDDIDKTVEFYYGRDENGNFLEEPGKDSEYNKLMSELSEQNKMHSGYGTDSINEAAVMAMAYVAVLEMNPSSEIIYRVNSAYKPRLSQENSMEKIITDLGVYEPNNPQCQQKFARKIFATILKDFGEKSMEKAKKHDKEQGKYKIDYSNDDFVKVLSYSYRPYFFGSLEDYVSSLPTDGASKNKILNKLKPLCVDVKHADKSTKNTGKTTIPPFKSKTR